jgi:hypothetical protein
MLTVEELREHVGDGPSDDVLDRLLDAAIQALDMRYGFERTYDEEVTERLVPYGSLVYPFHRAQSVSSVLEADVALDPADYEIRNVGRTIARLASDGTTTAWSVPVDVTYLPFDDDAERDRICVKLVELDLDYAPGLSGSTVGPWSEQHPADAKAYQMLRESILRTLRVPVVGIF